MSDEVGSRAMACGDVLAGFDSVINRTPFRVVCFRSRLQSPYPAVLEMTIEEAEELARFIQKQIEELDEGQT